MRAANRVVIKALFSHFSGLIQVSTIENNWLFKALANPVKVRPTKFVPFRADNKCISIFHRGIPICRIGNAVTQYGSGRFDCFGVKGCYRRAVF